MIGYSGLMQPWQGIAACGWRSIDDLLVVAWRWSAGRWDKLLQMIVIVHSHEDDLIF